MRTVLRRDHLVVNTAKCSSRALTAARNIARAADRLAMPLTARRPPETRPDTSYCARLHTKTHTHTPARTRCCIRDGKGAHRVVRSTCTTVSWPASILSSGTNAPQPAAKSENDSVGSAAGTVRRAVRCCAGGSKRALRAQGGTVSGACTTVWCWKAIRRPCEIANVLLLDGPIGYYRCSRVLRIPSASRGCRRFSTAGYSPEGYEVRAHARDLGLADAAAFEERERNAKLRAAGRARGASSPVADVAGSAQSRCRCGSGEPSPGADVGSGRGDRSMDRRTAGQPHTHTRTHTHTACAALTPTRRATRCIPRVVSRRADSQQAQRRMQKRRPRSAMQARALAASSSSARLKLP